jgi:hypothetical protein
LAVSIIAVAEVYESAFGTPGPQVTLAGLRDFLGDFAILPLTDPIVEHFARMRALLRLHGDLIPDMDLFIPAIANASRQVVGRRWLGVRAGDLVSYECPPAQASLDRWDDGSQCHLGRIAAVHRDREIFWLIIMAQPKVAPNLAHLVPPGPAARRPALCNQYTYLLIFDALVARLRSMPDGGADTMATTLKTVRITAETALPDLLDEAAQEPIILERDGERYRLSREEDIAYEPDSEGVRAMLAATAGSWADLDIDEMIREIYEARETGSRPLDRP